MMANNENRPGPTLNLDRSRTDRAFDLNESVWEEELRRMFELLRTHRTALNEFSEKPEEKDFRKAPQLSIGIFGTYGAGKSSLLKTFVQEARRPRSDVRAELDNVYALPVIEPNLQSNDEHFLYSFLAIALEEDLKKQEQKEGKGASGTYRLSPVQQAFQEVSEYLQVIDRGRGQQEYDPLGLSLERLERHTSDLLLREKLGKLIDELATSLAGRTTPILLLPVDDIDHSLNNLVTTLDTYKRYLLHPRLVPVFTFTGRLAEELLRVQFARELSVQEGLHISDRLREASTSLDITEQLAYQYLIKLFPIRNRIRLGPAPARVQRMEYTRAVSPSASNGNSNVRDASVWNLLETASRFLFGHPEWPITPRIRLLLRPTTLRRQLQVLDAIHDSQVHRFVGAETVEGVESRGVEHSWAWTFNRAAWALLNVHRDVLREFGLHVEDLYSWTPRNLRSVVLDTVLSMSPEQREKLVQRWQYRAHDRRGQVLSLLVAEAFRPQMPHEEPTGDDPDRTLAASRVENERPEESEINRWSFPMRHGLVWFLNVWIGFYLPLILASKQGKGAEHRYRGTLPGRRTDPEEQELEESDMIQGVGWSLRNGPLHAVDEAVRGRSSHYPGIEIFDGEPEVSSFLRILQGEEVDSVKPEKQEEAEWTRMVFHLWCNYGYNDHRPWIAISLWRGLGLLGQLLDDYERARNAEGEELELRVGTLLKKHCTSARRPGATAMGGKGHAVWTEGEPPVQETTYKTFAAEMVRWLEDYRNQRIDPLLLSDVQHPKGGTEPENQGEIVKNSPGETKRYNQQWRDCFLRAVHGEYLVGDLWPRLEGTYSEPASEPTTPTDKQPKADGGGSEWSASAAMDRWVGTLLTYLDKPLDDGNDESDKRLKAVLEKCPLLAPWIKEYTPEGHTPEELKASLPRVREVFRTLGKTHQPEAR